MPLETSYERAGYYLEYLQFLRFEMEKLAGVLGLDIQWMIERLCAFSCESDFSKFDKHYSLDENWTQLLSVYHNLLSRGVPTYPTAHVEKFLVSEASNVIPIEESSDKQIIAFRDQLTGAQKEKWLQVLVQAHAAVDYRCDKPHGNPESREEKAFLKYISEKIGPSVFQTIECQRPFSTITKASDKEEFYDQRVDFSLETRNSRIIIEIDGEQHLEKKQLRLDKQRQEYLEKNNWNVIRIPASKVRQEQVDEILEVLKKSFSDDPFLVATKQSFDQPINTEEAGRAALLLVITPIAIARIQWVLNWAFMKGKLDLHQPTVRIAIVEEDIPCAFLAVWDFIKSLSHLKSLAGIESSLPRIELEIVRNNDFESFPDGMGSIPNDSGLHPHVSRMDEVNSVLQKQFDLVIVVSSLHVGAKSPGFKFGQSNWVAISSVFSPRGMSPRFESASPINYHIHKDNTEGLLFFLQWIFRKREFLDGQIRILERSLANKDVIGLLPTGGGKSLCYQLSAILQPGMTLIVDPLISLMHDQVDNLEQLQIDAIASLSSDQTTQERNETNEKMVQHFLLMLFVSPERLQIQTFREKLGDMCLHTLVPYVVIDEAHCVSEWGHDFRPSYLRLADNARKVCMHHGFKPSVIGLTGTASWVVLSDIQREIDINEDEAIITPKSFDRQELEYEVVKCGSDAKISKITAKILELPQRFKKPRDSFFTNENAGIIFCPHVNGSHGIREVANRVHQNLHDLIQHVRTYSGGTPRDHDPDEWKQNKMENQKAFKENEVQLMVATKAFGMGIDKPNVRYTIHYGVPTSLEAFYQEAGRAGRDKERAICMIIFSGEPSYWKELITTDLSIEELVEKNRKIPYNYQDDVYRMLYLHGKAWQGIELELQSIMNLVNQKIMPATKNLSYDERKKFLLPFKVESDSDDESPVKTEKALYRLSVLGLISDYTLDHNAKQFEAEAVHRSDEFLKSALLDYFERYKSPEYRDVASQRIELAKGQTVLEKCVRAMLEFVYEEIEKKRRRAILHMAEVADTSLDGESFRTQLLDYLEKSEFTQQLADMAKRTEPMEWVNIASKAEDIDSSKHLLGGCRRALESYPDHPGLLLLSAFSRLLFPKPQDDMAISDFQRAIKLLARLPEREDIRKAITRFLEMIKQKRPTLINDLCHIVLKEFPQRDMARVTLKYADPASEGGILALRILLESTLEKTKLVRIHVLGGELS